MKIATLTAVVAVASAAALAPLVADRMRRWVVIPSVVLEILLGPAVLGWVVEDDVIGFVADFGLAMLMFLAGYESDVLLGAFAAGIVFRLFLDSGDRHEADVVESKLDAIGFGLLVPFFFVVSGARFGLPALVSDVGALLLLPAFLALMLVIHGAPVLALQRQLPAWPARSALALVGAGLLSVLILPIVAMGLWRTSTQRTELTP